MRANYKVELASGVFLLLGVAALIWLATRATDYGQDIGKESYFISARFTNVADLKNRAPVKIGGVVVGLVEAIELDPVTFEAVVKMRIDSRFAEIPDDTSASILTSGVPFRLSPLWLSPAWLLPTLPGLDRYRKRT